jgi:hypothetical protein
VTITADADELAEGYEALRAQATGEITTVAPRGLGVLVRAGVVA